MTTWNTLKNVAFGLTALTLFSSQVSASGGSPARGYTETDHPIVMIGGFLAFDDILGINYFHQIPGSIASGGGKAYPVNVSAFSSTVERGEQLIDELEDLQAIHGHTKLSLIHI